MRHLAIPAMVFILSYALQGQDTTSQGDADHHSAEVSETISEASPIAPPVGDTSIISDTESPDTGNSTIVYPRGTTEVQSSPETQPINGMFEGEGSAVGMMITILGYLLILGAFLIAAWFLFKRGVFRKSFTKTEGKLEIKESKMLGNRQFLMVVEYEDNKILLGVGPGKIDYLTSLNTYRNEFPGLEENVQENIQKGLR